MLIGVLVQHGEGAQKEAAHIVETIGVVSSYLLSLSQTVNLRVNLYVDIFA